MGNGGAPLALPGGVRPGRSCGAKIQGFIEAIDDVLAVAEPDREAVAGSDGASDPPDAEAP